MEASPETLYQTFVRLLYAAHSASEAVDFYDIGTGSDSQLTTLSHKQDQAFYALHQFCRETPPSNRGYCQSRLVTRAGRV